MAILTKSELLAKLKERTSEDTGDDTLKFIEDVTDTLNDFESKAKDTTDWEKKYKENDEQWRKKYKERFFTTPIQEDEQDIPTEEEPKLEKLTYENLFKEEK